jgi:glycosyltransferase involved in cell wall biosynthesis
MAGDARAQPLISIIITSYNYLHYITTAIDSVRAQTYQNVEIVVSDNCSTDGTVPVLRERYAADPRVRIFENERNVGELVNSNRGLERSTGAFVCWLSADDWMLPRHLARLAAVFAAEPAADVVYSDAYFATPDGRIYQQRLHSGALSFPYVDARDELVEMLTSACPLCWPTALFRRSVFDDVGVEAPEDGIVGTDWELQVRIALAGKRFGYVPAASVAIRIHPTQKSTGQAYLGSPQRVIDFVRLLEKHADHPGMDRIRGREGGIARLLRLVVAHTVELAGDDALAPELRARVDAMCARLDERAERYEAARVTTSTVSVVLHATRAPQLALRAARSVAEQQFTHWQLVVIDGGTVWLRDALDGAFGSDERVVCVRPPARLTPGAARNLGTRLARGEYLAFLDEDSTFAPSHFAQLAETIARSGARVAAAPARLVTEIPGEHFLSAREFGTHAIYRNATDSPERSRIADALPLDTVLIYRRFLDLGLRFNEDAPILGEYDFLLKLEAAMPFAFASAASVDIHARIDFSTTLGRHLPIYTAVLDNIYAANPAPEVAAARARHRATVSSAIERVTSGGGVTAESATALLATLAGSTIRSFTA